MYLHANSVFLLEAVEVERPLYLNLGIPSKKDSTGKETTGIRRETINKKRIRHVYEQNLSVDYVFYSGENKD